MSELLELDGITFAWDRDKNRKNIEKHGVCFIDAARVFFDPFFKVVDSIEDDETRECLIGMDESWRVLYVVYIMTEGECVRIISVRKACRNERKLYEEQ